MEARVHQIKDVPCLFARAEKDVYSFTVFCIDGILVQPRNATVISDVTKTLKAVFHIEDRRDYTGS